jgi:alkylated DNA repair dioxygenase AlkB
MSAPHQISFLGAGDPAVAAGARFERIRLGEHAWIDRADELLVGSDTLLVALAESVDWQQGRRWMYERMVDDPRLSRWYRRSDSPPHPVLADARDALEARYGVPLRGPALNYYRDGRDSVAPHADRELRVLDDTLVAILTLGARRPFLMRPKGGGRSRDLSPGSGDLLVMGGRTQLDWEHAVPKVAFAGPRISVSWRWSPVETDAPGTLEE